MHAGLSAGTPGQKKKKRTRKPRARSCYITPKDGGGGRGGEAEVLRRCSSCCTDGVNSCPPGRPSCGMCSCSFVGGEKNKNLFVGTPAGGVGDVVTEDTRKAQAGALGCSPRHLSAPFVPADWSHPAGAALTGRGWRGGGGWGLRRSPRNALTSAFRTGSQHRSAPSSFWLIKSKKKPAPSAGSGGVQHKTNKQKQKR